jgi:hypothetical protein
MTSLANRLRITHSDSCSYEEDVHGDTYFCNCGASVRNEAADYIVSMQKEAALYIEGKVSTLKDYCGEYLDE